VQSDLVERVYCAPGNGGTGGMARNIPIGAADVVRIVDFAKRERLGLVVLGPEAAVEAFGKAFSLGYRKPTTLYNLACSHARLDQKDTAFDYLFKALEAGFDAAGTLRGDEDLDNLRDDPRFRKALEMARARKKSEDD